MSNLLRIRTYLSESESYLGDSILIQSILSDIPTSAKITIKDPGSVILVDNVNMDEESGGIYSYVYQSVITNPWGRYTVIISAVYNGKTFIDILEIYLKDQPNLRR